MQRLKVVKDRGKSIVTNFSKSVSTGCDVLRKASKPSWFECLGSSTLMHWRWPEFQVEDRDGFPIMFTKSNLRLSPNKVRKPAPPREDSLKLLHYKKLKKGPQCRLCRKEILSLGHYIF